MKCPYCNCEEDKVVDSRTTKEGKAIRRRRECLACDKRYTTYEYIESVPRVVVKNNGSTEPYDGVKLLTGIYTACKKRPISKGKIQEVVEQVESKISEIKGDTVSSRTIGEIVLNALYQIDQVAYMRYASVYRNFKEVSEFLTQIDEMSVEPEAKQNFSSTNLEK